MSKFVDDVTSGDRLRALEALREKLAHAIEYVTEPKDLAPLSLRLTRVLAEIDELGGATRDEESDDLAERRRAKLSAAAES